MHHAIYKMTVNFSLSLASGRLALIIQTNGSENFGRCGKSGKKIIPWKVLAFLGKNSAGMNR